MEADNALLIAARRMDGDALRAIFDLYSLALYKYSLRLCNNAVMADQIVGDVFAKLLEHLSAGTGPRCNLRPYLFEIAYHLFVDEVRCSSRKSPIEAADLIVYDRYSTPVTTENRMLFETVRRAIRNDLTEDQRHVIILRFLEEFSVKETALILGKKVNNVKVIQNRAIASLRKALDYQLVETGDISNKIRSMANA
jgi:RNA polymerase sigma-70 factor, ECF subfamily